ncbi:MAG: 2-oxoacid:acceptor oxidoreductase subunit alpha [candidate division Zixibacteria bacterium]|nr:2-oxoacid:acceptor oxidoreductase subunit alpha [Candidatus Tariuqbacter arcticus]
MMGDEASAEGAVAAGCRFFAGYPITPTSELMVHIVKRFEEVGGKFIQMEDEIGSVGAMVGASWAGGKVMTATSGPGLSLMMENIGYAAMTETPMVIVDIQRAGPSTGQATRPGSGDILQVKYGSHGDYEIIALSPWSVQEMYDLTIEAFNLAEAYRAPVFLLADEGVGHLRENFTVKGEVEVYHRPKAKGLPPFDTGDEDMIPPMPAFGEGEKLLITGSTHDEWGYRKTQVSAVHDRLVKRLVNKIRVNAGKIHRWEAHFIEDIEYLVVAYGISARAALKTVMDLRKEGIKIGLWRPITIWPFPEEALKEAAEGVKAVIVPEMNHGQLVREVERHLSVPVHPIAQVDGEIMRPETIDIRYLILDI